MIVIDFFFFEIFAIEDIRRKCNTMTNLPKFTSNTKIFNGAIALGYN